MDKNLDDILSRLHEPAPSAEAKERALNSAMAAFDKKPAANRAQAPSSYNLILPELLGGISVFIIIWAVLNMLSGSILGLPIVLHYIAVVFGVYLVVTSILKLCNGNALVYFAASACLLAMPYMTGTMAGSVAGNGTAATGFQAQQFAPPVANQGGYSSRSYNNVSPDAYSGVPLPQVHNDVVSHASNTFLSHAQVFNISILCIGLLLGLAAWAMYVRIKKR